jgi:hypothetical protein
VEQEGVSAQKLPSRWASDIRCILRQVLGEEALPVDVGAVAKELSRQRFPDDPVSAVTGEQLPGFDGALIPDPEGTWFAEECRELILPSERYDFTISLLLFSDTLPDWDTQQESRAWGLGLTASAV